MMEAAVGSRGITEAELEALQGRFADAHTAMVSKRAAGKMDFRDLPRNQIAAAEEILDYVKETEARADMDVDAFVLLGIGGSALGPMAVQQAINNPYYNELSLEERGGHPKFYVADNVDPERLVYLFKTVDPKHCLFNVVSKSGSTSETMSQFMIIKELLERELGKEDTRKRIVCTTDQSNGNLIKIAREEGYKTFYIPAGVGGRFSQLCPVGLLPAAFCGIDILELLRGAAEMDDVCKRGNVRENPAYMYAALHYIAMGKGMNISVMMPYADSLKYISDWYAQLWAESLGKRYNTRGEEVFAGQTPVKALGVTDQHSQVQLYAEGPFDKLVVFLGVDEYREALTIPKSFGDVPSLGFLGGVTHNELINVERMATEYALQKAGRPSMTITLPKVDERGLGQLLYLFEAATAFAGELMGINAFDQPGVEEGKNAAYAYFGRPGYEEKKKELDARPAKSERYVI
jgi:glucose-6-phosphate isomerase